MFHEIIVPMESERLSVNSKLFQPIETMPLIFSELDWENIKFTYLGD
ncbi:protein of unknown function [Xenorhabdus poinarii G6]|uniref:Uncharacterized protein n=1 Tax=Xenorhabdus poinarii G6 TaxID=1354304 RepID=A0A068QZ96_9GAMM|nr:protein of unknown function [Xenorhabdus poinarii G6]